MASLAMSITLLVLMTIVVGWLIAALVYFGRLKNVRPECSAVHNTPASWMFWLGLIVTIIAVFVWVMLIFDLIRKRHDLRIATAEVVGRTKNVFAVNK